MKKYQSNTYFRLDYLATLIPAIIGISLLVYFFDLPALGNRIALGIVSFLILICFWIVWCWVKIDCGEHAIIVKYIFSKRTVQIPYSKIRKFNHVNAYAQTSRNIIRYKDSNGDKLRKDFHGRYTLGERK